jgi:hypothetical protein
MPFIYPIIVCPLSPLFIIPQSVTGFVLEAQFFDSAIIVTTGLKEIPQRINLSSIQVNVYSGIELIRVGRSSGIAVAPEMNAKQIAVVEGDLKVPPQGTFRRWVSLRQNKPLDGPI